MRLSRSDSVLGEADVHLGSFPTGGTIGLGETSQCGTVLACMKGNVVNV